MSKIKITTTALVAALASGSSVYLLVDGEYKQAETKAEAAGTTAEILADSDCAEEILAVGDGVNCEPGQAIFDKETKPRDAWVCCVGGGCVPMNERLSACLEKASSKLRTKKAAVEVEPAEEAVGVK